MDALNQIDRWPAANAAAVVARAGGPVAGRGDLDRPFPWASVTKLLTALAALVAVEEGTIDLDEPAGPEGSTVRHLLAHASGLPLEGDTALTAPGRRRIYSNHGVEVAADLVAGRAAMPFGQYLAAAVLEPLAIGGELEGSPGAGFVGSARDLAALGTELLAPTIVAPETLAEATSVQFPGLGGVLPGFGRMAPNDWGLGFELRDEKRPHWTGARSSPRTFGHFGRSGTFLWVDPDAGLALGALTDEPFGDWAAAAWPALSDAVLAEAA
ncbi:MAG TPA: serine hydrolase domain-containing protein [Gaiellaceae bacterium]|nr:serine hydrolase domain-containing protein [Gaiellaceae bacterium]